MLLGITLGASSYATDAHASGLFVAQRGVRPLGRGGAFVAGADDLGAVAYNPAGIYDAGSQFLFDASWVGFNSDYTREAMLREVDPNSGETVATYKQTFPTVSGDTPFLPIPTIVGSFSPHPDWMIALGAYAPYGATPSYPDTVGGKPAPQRYSLISLDGTLLAVVGGWAAWAPLKNLRLGLGVELLVGSFSATTMMSGCIPERFFCSPEDPAWDVLAQINAAPIITPSGNVGATWEFAKGWRLGGSFHLPFWIRAPATVTTRLPESPVFDRSTQEGDSATVVFSLPFTARLGIEWRDPVPGLRIEVAGHYEHWQMHDTINVEPSDIALTNLPGFPKQYFIPDVQIPQNFQASGGVELGVEYSIKASQKIDVTPRAGFSYETSAIPPEALSVLVMDSNRITPSVGASLRYDNLRFDVVYARVIAQEVQVAAKDARIPQTVPLKANPPKNPDYINGGTYDWNANVVGIGMTYTFGHPKQAPTSEKKEDQGLPTTEEPARKPAPPPAEAAPENPVDDAKPDDTDETPPPPSKPGDKTKPGNDKSKPADKNKPGTPPKK